MAVQPLLVVFFALLTTVLYLLVVSVAYEPLAQDLTANYGETMSIVDGVALVDSLWSVLYIYVPLLWVGGAVLYAVFRYLRRESYVGEVPR